MDTAAFAQKLGNGTFGLASGLVGAPWNHYLRLPHPARRRGPDGEMADVSWAEVAGRRGVSSPLSRATWFEVSGSRAHSGRPSPFFDEEPQDGPLASELIAAAIQTLSSAAHDASVFVGQWDGWPETPGGGDLVPLGRWTYFVREFPLDEALDLLRSSGPGGSRVLPDVAWSPAGQWALASPTDLFSTYVGLADVRVQFSLESIEVEATVPVS